jgi:hypothetical protein
VSAVLRDEIDRLFEQLDRLAAETGPDRVAEVLLAALDEYPRGDLTRLAAYVQDPRVATADWALRPALDALIFQVGFGPLFGALVGTAGCMAADAAGRGGGSLSNAERVQVARALLVMFWYTQRGHRTGELERVQPNRRTVT